MVTQTVGNRLRTIGPPVSRRRVLRARLPKKITTTPEERRKLIKAGRKVSAAIKELISIVTPATFLRWLNAEEKKPKGEKSARTRSSTNARPSAV
jgi:putative transposase